MTQNNESFVPVHEIVRALMNDPVLEFRDAGSTLQGGKCPSCGKKELFVSKERPWIIACNRKNNCGSTFKVSELVPELFTNFAERFQPTEKEPNKTADAYLTMTRGFDISKINGWYEQAACRLPNTNEYCTTVRFYLDKERTRYWERLIDKTDKAGKKAHFGGRRRLDGKLTQGDAWTPPDQTLEDGDKCFIVEGIFHAIALFHHGIKVAAAFSCHTFPSNFIDKHKDKDITWVLALDGDNAGKNGILKHAEKLKELELKYEAVIPPSGGEDWDDLHKHGKIDGELFYWGRYRGEMLLAEEPEDKAYIHYKYYKNMGEYKLPHKVRKSANYFIFEHKGEMFRADCGEEFRADFFDSMLKNAEETKENRDAILNSTQTFDEYISDFLWDQKGKDAFGKAQKVERICDSSVQCVYYTQDALVSDDRAYVFKIRNKYQHEEIIPMSHTDISVLSNFKTSLVKYRTEFSGCAKDHAKLLRKWIKVAQKHTVLRTRHLGYIPEYQCYCFNDKAFHKGREIPLNSDGYFQIGNHGIRTELKGVPLTTNGKHDPTWIKNFVQVFDYPGLAMLSFWIGSLFVTQVRNGDGTKDEHGANVRAQASYPFAELTGEPGAGKTTLLEFLWKIFGRDQHEGFDALKSTQSGRRRILNQLSNMPTVITESDRDHGENSPKTRQFSFDEFKDLYNGRSTGVIGVKNAGNEVVDEPFNGSLVISQNATVNASDAIIERIVYFHMDKSHHKANSRELANWFKRQTAESVGGLLSVALKKEKALLDSYYFNFDFYNAKFDRELDRNGRIALNHAQIAAWGATLPLLFPDLDKQHVHGLVSYLLERGEERIDRLQGDHPLVALFWTNFHHLNEEANNREVGFLDHSNNPNEIAISMPEVEKVARNEGVKMPDMLELQKHLPFGKTHKLIASNVAKWSPKYKRTKKCWVFTK